MVRYLRGFVLLVLAAPPVIAAPGAPTIPRLQESDAQIERIAPVTGRDEKDEKTIRGTARYMVGQLYESRGDLQAAFNAYKKGIEEDPRSNTLYRAAISVAFRLDRTEEGVRLAEKAVSIDGDDVDLRQLLGSFYLSQNRLKDAKRLFEEALKSPKLNQKTARYPRLMRDLGAVHLVQGEKAEAAKCFRVVFDAIEHPANYELPEQELARYRSDPLTRYERLGEIFLDGGELDLASKAFDRAAQVGRLSESVVSFNKARVLASLKKYDESLAELEKYFNGRRRNAKGREPYALLVTLLRELNRPDEIIGRLEKITEKDAVNSDGMYFLAEQLVAAGDFDRAKEIYEKALKKGKNVTAYIGLAEVLRKQKSGGELVDVLGRAVEVLDRDSNQVFGAELERLSQDEETMALVFDAGRKQAKTQPSELTFEESYVLAKLAVERKNIEIATEFYELALGLRPERSLLVYVELGEFLKNEKKYADAVKVFERALADKTLEPRRLELLYELCQLRELAGDMAGALEAVAEGKKLDPDNIGFEFQEAWIYYRNRSWIEAIPRLEKLIAKSEGGRNERLARQCQFMLSNTYVSKGEIRKGEEILEAIYRENPTDPSVCNDLGYLYADQGKNLDQAEAMIKISLSAEPENSAYLDSMGWVMFKKGKYQEALTYQKKAMELRPEVDATMWDHYGDIMKALGQEKDAVESWQKALKSAENEKLTEANLIERVRTKLQKAGVALPAEQTPPDASKKPPSSSKE